MSTASPRLALLRGINVGGHKRLPMATLRALATELGWSDVATYIQSGNLLFRAAGDARRLERALEAAIAERLGFAAPVIVRPAKTWLGFADGGPFPDAEHQRPSRLHVGVAQRTFARNLASALAAAARNGERVAVRGQALWIDSPAGIARSKLTPAVLDRAAGSTVTLRNWKSVQAIAERLRAL